MVNWRAILLVYDQINVRLPRRWFTARTFHLHLSDLEVSDAVESFQQFPRLAHECSGGEVSVIPSIVHIDRPLDSVTAMGANLYWPSPTDTRQELDQFAAPGTFDSVFVLWPQNNPRTGDFIPSGGWGLGMGASDWSNGATFATVANAPTAVWRRPERGEVWLHEWLHGVCHHFAQQGFGMPDGDADGGARHGYVQSAETGWCEYYRDLMTGNVSSGGKLAGIPADAWQRGSILSTTT